MASVFYQVELYGKLFLWLTILIQGTDYDLMALHSGT